MIGYLRDPELDGDLSTRMLGLWATGIGRLLGYGRFGCGGDRLQGCEVAA